MGLFRSDGDLGGGGQPDDQPVAAGEPAPAWNYLDLADFLLIAEAVRERELPLRPVG